MSIGTTSITGANFKLDHWSVGQKGLSLTLIQIDDTEAEAVNAYSLTIESTSNNKAERVSSNN